MYVRLGFSIAVNLDPEVLLIDEILAVGDEEFQRRSMDHLLKLRRDGVTILLVSHSLQAVQTLCDRAAWLSHGQVCAEGASSAVVDAYLAAVNSQERDRLHGQRGTPADGVSTTIDGVAIEAVEFIGPGGAAEEAVVTGDRVVIRIRYVTRSELMNPIFGLLVHHESGIDVAGTHTQAAGVKVGRVAGRGHIDFVVDRLSLMPGVYLVTTGISDDHGVRTLAQREKADVLRVQPRLGTRPWGLVELEGHWGVPTPDAEVTAAGGAIRRASGLTPFSQ